jgi:phospholipase C
VTNVCLARNLKSRGARRARPRAASSLEVNVLRTIRRLSYLTALSTAAYLATNGCAANHSPLTPSDDQNSGSIGLLLVGGGSIASFGYTITGPAGFSRAGTIDVSSSSKLAAIVGGLPVGAGYTLTVTGTSGDGTTNCSGTASFAVAAGATTAVALTLDCHQPAKTGGVSVTGTINICPTLTSLAASPDEILAGSSTSVSAAASDPDNAPAPLAFKWAASSGTFSDATSASPTFTCTAPGTSTLTVTVSDGDASAGCAATGSLTVTCSGHLDAAAELPTATKIKHLVVIFDENISYDHYFATYPNAANLPGDPAFSPAGPAVSNNLVTPLDVTNGFSPLAGVDLLNHNPVAANPANGTSAVNPFRLGSAQAFTNDMGHNYKPEQQAADNNKMDLFPEFTGTAGPPPGAPPAALTKGLVMAYYDGNTLGRLWGLAQQYAMNDNSYSTVFGPSTPGAINLVSGQTNGFLSTNKDPATMSVSHVTPDGNGGWTMIGDTDPLGDVCSTAGDQNTMAGTNVGDLLNAKGVSWGWFQGGFDLTITNANGTTGCQRETDPTVPFTSTSADYIPHHAPFQYYPSTANPTHARPSSVAAIGSTVATDGVTRDLANHQYDSHDFFDALKAGNLPAVVYLKAPAFQDGHPGYSDPIDEQNWLVQVVSTLQASQEWQSTAIVLAYDDSDGWYDHQASPIVNPSTGVADALNGPGVCNQGVQQTGAAPTTPLAGNDGKPALGRCGYGTRQPLMVISPFAKKNFIDHTLTDQTSILRFVEDNWLGGRRIQAGGSFDTIASSITNMLNL